MRRVIPRRQNLQNAKAVLAVSDESKRAGGDHSDFHVVDVVELAFRRKKFIELRRLRLFDINDRKALFARRNIRVGARNIDIASILERNAHIGHRLLLREIGNVQNLQSVTIHNKRIAKLQRDAARIVECGRANAGSDTRSKWIVEIHDDQSLLREDVRIGARDRDPASARQYPVGIEGQSPLQEIVGGIAVEQRANAGTFRFQIGVANDDQAFFFVRDVQEAIEKMNPLLFILGQLLTQWIDS